MKKLILVLMASILSLSASATINKDNEWVCTSYEKNEELNNAIRNNDKQAMDYLLSYHCVVFYKGQKVTIIEGPNIGGVNAGIVKIRIYPKKGRPTEIYMSDSIIDYK